MARLAKRMYGPAQVATGPTTVITVPSSRQYVIRKIHVDNPGGGSAATITISIGADAAGTRIVSALSIAAGDFKTFWGPWTLDAAEILTVSSGTNNALVIEVDGDIEVLA